MRYTRLRRQIETGTLIGTHGTPFQGGAEKIAEAQRKRRRSAGSSPLKGESGTTEPGDLAKNKILKAAGAKKDRNGESMESVGTSEDDVPLMERAKSRKATEAEGTSAGGKGVLIKAEQGDEKEIPQTERKEDGKPVLETERKEEAEKDQTQKPRETMEPRPKPQQEVKIEDSVDSARNQGLQASISEEAKPNEEVGPDRPPALKQDIKDPNDHKTTNLKPPGDESIAAPAELKPEVVVEIDRVNSLEPTGVAIKREDDGESTSLLQG
jgi:hypothetical protein